MPKSLMLLLMRKYGHGGGSVISIRKLRRWKSFSFGFQPNHSSIKFAIAGKYFNYLTSRQLIFNCYFG
jgi:hypothetical protein